MCVYKSLQLHNHVLGNRFAVIEEIGMLWLEHKMYNYQDSLSSDAQQRIYDLFIQLGEMEWTGSPSERSIVILARASILLYDIPSLSLSELQSRLDSAFNDDCHQFPLVHETPSDDSIIRKLLGNDTEYNLTKDSITSSAFHRGVLNRFWIFEGDLEWERSEALGLNPPSLRDLLEARMYSVLCSKLFQLNRLDDAVDAAIKAYAAETRSLGVFAANQFMTKAGFQTRALLEDIIASQGADSSSALKLRSKVAFLNENTMALGAGDNEHMEECLKSKKRSSGGIPKLRRASYRRWLKGDPNWKPHWAPFGRNGWIAPEWAWSTKFDQAQWLGEAKKSTEMVVYSWPQFGLVEGRDKIQ